MTTIAYCHPDGGIGLGAELPDGATEIVRGPEDRVRPLIALTAKAGFEVGTFYVPGVFEAKDSAAANQALIDYVVWIAAIPRGRGLRFPLKEQEAVQ